MAVEYQVVLFGAVPGQLPYSYKPDHGGAKKVPDLVERVGS